jgi:hypothetical protein
MAWQAAQSEIISEGRETPGHAMMHHDPIAVFLRGTGYSTLKVKSEVKMKAQPLASHRLDYGTRMPKPLSRDAKGDPKASNCPKLVKPRLPATLLPPGDIPVVGRWSSSYSYAFLVTVTAQNYSRAYGDSNPVNPGAVAMFTYIITGFVNGDTQSVVSGAPSLTTTATTSSAPGAYPITAALGTLSAVNYTFSTFVKGTLTVTKATTTISWAYPAAITYGTALSATQLDATAVDTDGASVTGTFVYTPAAGTVLPAGTQTLSVTFTPKSTADYTTATGTVQLVVSPELPTITWATPAAIKYGTALSGTQLDATANVAGTFVYSPAAGTVLAAGPQTLSVTFTPTNTNYATVTSSVSLTVNKASLTVTAQNASRAYGAANPTFSDTFAGFVNGDTQSVVTGAASLTTTATTSSAVGTYPITAALGTLSAANYTFSTFVNGTLTITQASSTVALASSANPSANGASVTFTATVSPSLATGTITFKDGSATLGTGAISSGQAAFSIATLAVGSHSITASYAGDANDNSSTSSVLTQTVNKANTTVTVTSSANPSAYGSSVTFTATVTPTTATGTMTFADGSTTLGTGIVSSGQATFSISTLAVGSHSITASYGGDANDNSNTSSVLTQTVNKVNTTVTLASSANPSTYGSSVTFSATVSPATATGTVTFTDGSTTLGTGTISSGTATYSTSTLAVGSHSITASYGGDTNDNSSTSSVLAQAVNAVNTTVIVASSANPSAYGSLVTFTATVSPSAATGTVTFADGSLTLGTGTISSGIAAYSTSMLAAGSHSITAVYGGDANDNSSTSSVLAQIVNATNTAVTLASSANPSTSGASVTFTATVSPTTATGTVTFTDGSTTLGTGTISGGSATYTTSALSAGSHSITAAYSGDSNDNGSTSAVLTQTVQSGSSFVATSGQMAASRYGQTATQLTTGQVLIAGGMSSSGVVSSADLYTLASQTFAPANAMNVARWLHTATLLNDGTVLVAGGSDLANEETLDSAEIYNSATGTFTLLSSTLNTARVGHTATLLNNGQVLIVGGYDPDTGLIADAELYDPPTQTFIDLGDTNAPRYEHTATMLPNGQVLIAGGDTDPTPSAAFNTAEIFDLPSQTFTPVPVPMTTQREGHAAVLLNNGQVLITGGDNPPTGSQNSAEIYDPPSNTFTAVTSTMTAPRISQVMTVLNGGKVLIAGGATDSGGSSTALNTAEVYDPTSQTFTAVAGNMTSVREHQTSSLLNDGTVLEAGGTDGSNIFNTAELYMPSQLNGLASIAITPAAPSLGVGAQQLFTAVGTFSNGSTQTLSSVLWSSSSAATAPISGDATNPGVAATTAQGTTTITASAAGVSGSATLTVTTPTLVSITLGPQDATIPVGATQQFAATGVYTDGSTQDLTATATWSSWATVVAAINSSGLAAGLFQGTATIQVNSGSLSASTTLSVGSPALVSIAVNPATATIAAGTSQQYQAIGTYSDGRTQDVTSLLTWSSGTPAVATVTNTGLATGLGQGTATLTGGFESVSASATLTVAAPNLVSITVVPNAASLSIGGTQQLSATGNYTDGSAQNLTASSTWASSNPNIIGVSSAGLATAVAAGNATITATSGSTSGTAALIVTTGTTQTNLNTSRYQHSATILNNGQILVAGGVNCPTSGSCTYLSSAELYNPATSAFTYTGGPMATARSAPAVLLNSGKVFIAGGYACDGSGNCSSLISAEIYNPTAGTFSSAGTMTAARSGHTMTVLANGTVLIAGGQGCTSATSCSALSSAEIYDPIAGTFTATSYGMDAALFGGSAVLLNSGSVLIAGGFDGTNFPAVAEIYTPSNGGFNFTGPGPSLNVPRYHATATLLNNGQVLVAGGSTCSWPGCPTNAAEIYDPVANTFTLVPGGTNVPRFHHSATLTTNGQVVIVGGFSSCASSCTSEASTEFFDPVAGSFTSGQPVATALAGHTGTLLPNGNVLLVGGINAGVTLASDEWYQPISFTPANLVSIAVAPASLFLMSGQTQQLVATGTFNDGSTQTLQSVIWNSSNPSAAVISNSPGTAGIVTGQGQGASTLTATAGDVGGAASLSVATLVSLTITPANPSITAGSGQQLTATGTFSDGSQQNVTSSVTWSSSNTTDVLIGTTASGLAGFATGVTSGTATITAALGSTQATILVTVQTSTTPNPPSITTVWPPTGAPGTQVTISGSGFGTQQGSGTVWLGSTYGLVVSWIDSQIVANVAAISQSGIVQVQQGGLLSNAVSFTVNTPTILNVYPTSGVPGTQVIISGSGFGTTQGSGQVWLGTVNGVVQNWSDQQITAVVANGSSSGNAQVLQNGVMSNAVPFVVNSLHIASVTPTSGGSGTSVTITGTGFGSSQSNGTVWLGSTDGLVTNWSNQQVTAVVAATAVSGIVKIEQNGMWSNGVTFTVPTSGANALTLVPNVLNLVVGQTQTIQALNASSQPVTGLTWASSNTNVVSLSTDDPPILTAVAAGNATITAGSASADVTVSNAALAPGTVIWSNPGDGSGVTGIVPAVPSAKGVADVFAFNADGTVQAVASDGTTAWTATLPNGTQATVPDFQGGLVVSSTDLNTGASSIMKLDGITGQAYPAYTQGGWSPVVHTDGTIFALTTTGYGNSSNQGTVSVIGINPTTGAQLFSVPLDQSTSSSSSTTTIIPGGKCPIVVHRTDLGARPMDTSSSSTSTSTSPNTFGSIIAGDGYFYIAYAYQKETSVSQVSYGQCPFDGYPYIRNETTDTVVHLMQMRVGTDGSSSKTDIKDWEAMYMFQENSGSDTYAAVTTGAIPNLSAGMITNADQGVVLTWEADTPAYCASGVAPACNTQVAAASTYGLGSNSVSSAVWPVLQAQDGTFYGTDDSGDMVRFDQSGNTIWSVPSDYPQIATADGGVIGSSGITYDSNGRATGQIANMPTQSWTGNGYQNDPGQAQQVISTPTVIATSFWPGGDAASPPGANASGTPVAAQTYPVKLHVFKLNGTANIDLAGIIKAAQGIWSKQSNGTIALLWDHSIQNVNPCVIPGCIRGIDEDDLLDIPSYEYNALWRKTNYFLQKFPDRQGINVVQNATLASGLGLTLPSPLAQSGQFSTTGPSNIIVLPNDTTKVLGHEVGHALGLVHVANPLNLMCGAPPGSNDFFLFIDNLLCFEWSATSLNDAQLKTAKATAASLVE